jgi:DNA polymerase III delta prime subunit
MDCKPWIEKYRPTEFNNIVLDNFNRCLLQNILDSNHFPNLLFYGPPGTGKTTTMMNIIDNYNKKYNKNLRGVIHLNASDDRGIDIIRNQINQFVNTKSIFGNNVKFVILDEVDYMTKNAQQALRYLIQQYSNNIRFCLICNYISKIDKSLQNEFIKLCFCNLPKKKIHFFLQNIIDKENLNIGKKQIKDIQYRFKSDIRSMINYIQTNHNNICINSIITRDVWENIIQMFNKKNKNAAKKNIAIVEYIKTYCHSHKISINIFISKFITYHIYNKDYCLNAKWLDLFQIIIHYKKYDEYVILHYFVNKLSYLYKSL